MKTQQMLQATGRPRVSDEVRAEIRRLFATNEFTREELAAKFSVSYNTVRSILKESAGNPDTTPAPSDSGLAPNSKDTSDEAAA